LTVCAREEKKDGTTNGKLLHYGPGHDGRLPPLGNPDQAEKMYLLREVPESLGQTLLFDVFHFEGKREGGEVKCSNV